MQIKKYRLTGVALILGGLFAGSAAAFGFGNVMNPTRWFNNNDNRGGYDDDYNGGPGYGGPGYGYPGYGGPGYGYPGYGYPGAGGPGYGAVPYGAPGYGAVPNGAPGYQPGAAAPLPAEPARAGIPKSSSSGSGESEVDRLKRRVQELEQSQHQGQTWGGDSSGAGNPRFSGGYQEASPASVQPDTGYGSQPGYQTGYQPHGGAPSYYSQQPADEYSGQQGYRNSQGAGPSYPAPQTAPGSSAAGFGGATGYGNPPAQYRGQ